METTIKGLGFRGPIGLSLRFLGGLKFSGFGAKFRV